MGPGPPTVYKRPKGIDITALLISFGRRAASLKQAGQEINNDILDVFSKGKDMIHQYWRVNTKDQSRPTDSSMVQRLDYSIKLKKETVGWKMLLNVSVNPDDLVKRIGPAKKVKKDLMNKKSGKQL